MQHKFVIPSHSKDYLKLVWIDTEKFDKVFQKRDTYIGKNGKNGIGNRYECFKIFWDNNETIEVSEIFIGLSILDNKETVDFTNGRHRYAYMRDLGMKKIPMGLDKDCIKYAKKYNFITK